MSKAIDWTDERIETLVALWESGLSASQVGAEMGVTRNSVIGKVHRLGNAIGRKRRRPSEQEKEQRRQQYRKKQTISQNVRRAIRRGETIKMMEEKPIPNYAGYLGTPFGELRPRRTYTANQCRYIAAEPPGPAYLACGTETDVGESWCYHCKGIMSARSGLTDEERALRIKQARGAAALAAAQRTIDHEMLRDAA